MIIKKDDKTLRITTEIFCKFDGECQEKKVVDSVYGGSMLLCFGCKYFKKLDIPDFYKLMEIMGENDSKEK